MIKDTVAGAISEAAEQYYGVKVIPELNYPDPRFGDYATNIAFQLAKELKQAPHVIAENLAKVIKDPAIAAITVAGGGFINIRLNPTALLAVLDQIKTQKDHYGSSPEVDSRRIVVEYGHPNTHKSPHIGHLFSYVAGDSLARILEFSGHKVRRVNYQGDIGPHVARCLYAWIQQGRPRPNDLLEKVKLLQQCYQDGSSAYEASNAAAGQIKQINRDLYDPSSLIQADWHETRQWSLDYYLEFEHLLGVKQEAHYLESQLWQKGMDVVKANTGKVFIPSQGAIIFPGEELGLHNRVFITSEGTPTYEAKEIGLNITKMSDWSYDLTIIPTAVEQNDYFTVVIAAINQTVPQLKNKIEHIGFGMVNLAGIKMSSRKGNVLSAADLVDVATTKATGIIADSTQLTDEEKSQIAQLVALGAIKYSFLKTSLGKNISFDIEKDINLDGNSGPYLQYSYARAQSVLRKVKNKPDVYEVTDLNDEERLILNYLDHFSEIIKLATDDYAPHHIATYLFELAQAFNLFYEKHRVIDTPEQNFRLVLIAGIAQVLATGLDLLGIQAPERM